MLASTGRRGLYYTRRCIRLCEYRLCSAEEKLCLRLKSVIAVSPDQPRTRLMARSPLRSGALRRFPHYRGVLVSHAYIIITTPPLPLDSNTHGPALRRHTRVINILTSVRQREGVTDSEEGTR